MKRERVVVLVSGGIDSATTLAVARDRGCDCYVLSFDYGQRHRCELDHCRKVVLAIGASEHLVFPIDMRPIGGSALTDSIDVPADRTLDEMAEDIPVTYVPARNTIFLSIALAWAEVLEARRIFIGANAVDYSGYPDCRPEFIRAFQEMANLATRIGVTGDGIAVEAPLIDMTKADILKRGTELGVDYSLTFSCYNPSEDGLSCGRCDSCHIRHRGFREAGLDDPTVYVTEPDA